MNEIKNAILPDKRKGACARKQCANVTLTIVSLAARMRSETLVTPIGSPAPSDCVAPIHKDVSGRGGGYVGYITKHFLSRLYSTE
jgi:hypothetical protein